MKEIKEILKEMQEMNQSLEKYADYLKSWKEELESRTKYNIVLQEGRYALIDRGHEYIVACGFNGNEWSQGYYYTHWNNEKQKSISLAEAVDCFRLLTDETYISRGRLVELATNFKDGLLCDDEESAMEYFDKFCDMNETEMQFFGLGEEEE